jgi:hypothetical protein
LESVRAYTTFFILIPYHIKFCLFSGAVLLSPAHSCPKMLTTLIDYSNLYTVRSAYEADKRFIMLQYELTNFRIMSYGSKFSAGINKIRYILNVATGSSGRMAEKHYH